MKAHTTSLHPMRRMRPMRRLSRHAVLLAAAAAAVLAAGLGFGLARQRLGDHGTTRYPVQPVISVDEQPATGIVPRMRAVPLVPMRLLVYLVDSEQEAAAMQQELGRPEPRTGAEPASARVFLPAGSVDAVRQAQSALAQLQQDYGTENVQVIDIRRNAVDAGP